MAHIVPATIAGLVALLRADPAVGDGVQVDHGPPRYTRDVPDGIVVGASAGADTTVSGGTTHRLGPREETAELLVSLESSTGASDDDALIRCELRAYELLDVLHAALERDRTLGGAVMTAAVARHVYRPVRDEGGTAAAIDATVRITGFRRRR